MTIHYFTGVLFLFHFCPVVNFGKFISFELGTVSSERVDVNYIQKHILPYVHSICHVTCM